MLRSTPPYIARFDLPFAVDHHVRVARSLQINGQARPARTCIVLEHRFTGATAEPIGEHKGTHTRRD